MIYLRYCTFFLLIEGGEDCACRCLGHYTWVSGAHRCLRSSTCGRVSMTLCVSFCEHDTSLRDQGDGRDQRKVGKKLGTTKQILENRFVKVQAVVYTRYLVTYTVSSKLRHKAPEK